MILKGNRSRRYVVDLSPARASTEAAAPCLALIESGMNTIKRDWCRDDLEFFMSEYVEARYVKYVLRKAQFAEQEVAHPN